MVELNEVKKKIIEIMEKLGWYCFDKLELTAYTCELGFQLNGHEPSFGEPIYFLLIQQYYNATDVYISHYWGWSKIITVSKEEDLTRLEYQIKEELDVSEETEEGE